MSRDDYSSKIPYKFLRYDDRSGNQTMEHTSVDIVKYINEKCKQGVSEDERPLVEADYEAKKHLTFGRPVYDPPGGVSNGGCRMSVSSNDDVSIASINDYIPPYRLRQRRRLLVIGVLTCLCVAILTVLAVGLHFGMCRESEFLCHNVSSGAFGDQQSRDEKSGFCIPLSRVCDRMLDCPDGSDERNCTQVCRNGMFACKTRTTTTRPSPAFCLDPERVCDGVVQCPDGSDELDCDDEASCDADQFRCQTDDVTDGGRPTCISKDLRCDRVVDCADGSDESDCRYSCPGHDFMCWTGTVLSDKSTGRSGYCVNPEKVCDGVDDCVDRSDELNCKMSCSADEFLCLKGFSKTNHNSMCISKVRLCDRIEDCTDGSDESNCTYRCPQGMEACRTGVLVRTSSGYCFSEDEKCNSVPDCEDESDEEGCPLSCSENEFKCQNSQELSLAFCISLERVCDRHPDCPDGADELNCTIDCPNEKTPCGDQTEPEQSKPPCIPLTQRCYGTTECQSSGSEFDCNSSCPDGTFHCARGGNETDGWLCLDEAYRCDRVEDCVKGSDEQGCEYSCPVAMIKCASGSLWDPVEQTEIRGYCLPEGRKCDGKRDCADGSDERNCLCSTKEFQCLNGRNTYKMQSPCIELRHVCDGTPDCSDGSDEINCTYSRYDCRRLARESFMALRCDGRVSCRNGEDENDCDVTCPADHFRCATSVNRFTGSVCTRVEHRCDRVVDCVDGSDEDGCQYSCPDNMFMCASKSLYDEGTKDILRGYCVPTEKKCDGRKQCLDGSDELSCSCPDDQFRCHSGRNNFVHGSRCVPRNHVCDRVADCSDSSDELNCDYKRSTCDYFDMTIRCDGKVDCKNGEDEENCDMKCSPDQFRCKTGVSKFSGSVCIKMAYRCDGLIDCVDGSDEDKVSCNYSCPIGHFSCQSGPLREPESGREARGFCIPNSLKCDGTVHCMDRSDEKLCPCKEGQFHCIKGHNVYNRISSCIPLTHRCDGSPDCSDKSDEKDCDTIKRKSFVFV